MTSTLVAMPIRVLTILMTLALLLQGGGVMQAVHWMQADAETVCIEAEAHHDHAPGHAPSHHDHDHCAVCLAIAGIRPLTLDLPTVAQVDSVCGQLVVESWKTPCFEAFLTHSARGPPAHV